MTDCDNIKGNEAESVLLKAKKAGMGTGIVTTTRINHASPSGAYANSAFRFWYSDADLYNSNGEIPESRKNCVDIAQQFVNQQHMIDVTLAGGTRYFCPENDTRKRKCVRKDGQDFLEIWKNDENLDFLETRDDVHRLSSNIGSDKSKN